MRNVRMTQLLHRLSLAAVLAVAAPLPAPAQTAGGSTVGGSTIGGSSGLPVPRFVSLRAEQVNMRTGPGDTHPVAWVYARRDLPVEITAEHKNWRRIRDREGAEGWVHQSLLSGRRTAMVAEARQPMRADPSEQAAVVALVDPGVVVRLVKCPKATAYCRVHTGESGYEGWLRRVALWGLYPNEDID